MRDISPAAAAGLAGMDKLAAETPRQIANAHTIFNLGIATVFLPFTSLFARFCEWIVPDKVLEEEEALVQASYLDEELIKTPSLALERARYEIGHMGEYVNEMLTKSMPAFLAGDHERMKEISEIDKQGGLPVQRDCQLSGQGERNAADGFPGPATFQPAVGSQ